MNRLDVADNESVRYFKRAIRQAMEVFLRFTHRYWYHQISNQDLARSLFQRLRRHLELDVLYEEVRVETLDMHGYLDSDALRRQANTVLRLTVVTIMGGTDVYVPEGIEVDVGGAAIMGANDEYGQDPAPRPGTPLIRLRMITLMGGADLWRVPGGLRGRTLREVRRHVSR